MPGEAILRLTDLRKSFGDLTVLDGMSLEVGPGERWCILGRSGSGKSVTLKLISGLLRPDSGSLRVRGAEVSDLSGGELRRLRRHIGFLFQTSALFDSYTIAENVAFPLLRERQDEKTVRERVAELLTRVGLEGHGDKHPDAVSGGMRKRVGLCRALALEPELLLADEPTAGLDPVTAHDIGDLLAELSEERSVTLLVVTHDLDSARRVCQRAAFLHRGRIARQGSFDELEGGDHPAVRRFFHPEAGPAAEEATR